MQGINLLFGVRITGVRYPKLIAPMHAKIVRRVTTTEPKNKMLLSGNTGVTLVPDRDVLSTEPQYSVYNLDTVKSGWYSVELPTVIVTFFVTKNGEATRIKTKVKK